MAKNSYTIASTDMSPQALTILFQEAKRAYPYCPSDIDILFNIANGMRELFPGINITGDKNESQYLLHWVKSYCDASASLPSSRTASPKSSCSDPAIKVIVQAAKNLSPEEAAAQESHHNLFMSAENIQGNLLEEYIASVVRPYGWIWCNGNALKAIDFCNTDGTTLLQIKNKSNTENSSSSAIRDGTAIEKWYRLGTRTVRGEKVPRYMWETLNRIINSHKTEGADLPMCSLTEESYQAFLLRVTSTNRQLITDM